MGKLNSIRANRSAYIQRYLWPLPRFRREFVVMVDGKLPHGGLTDRFRHILSVYSYCKEHKIPFRLYYIYPSPLKDILQPNEYDWRISASDLSMHFLSSGELDLFVDESNHDEFYNAHHLQILDKAAVNKCRKQYHIYGNAFFGKGRYSALFKELFKPSPYLTDRIAMVRSAMNQPYESVSLRFQMLLGDLDEGNYELLDEQEREALINRCITKIDELWKNHYFSTPKVLVTSDSSLFLSRVASKDYVYTIPGRMEHMDYSDNPDLAVNAKPFVDLFLLMDAKRLTLLQTGKMYRSGFPAFAAELGGRPYDEIFF